MKYTICEAESVEMNTAKPTPQEAMCPARAASPDDMSSVTFLRMQLESERKERERTRQLLELRTCALDSASTHFMITDVRVDGGIIVYVNQALARDHGYEPKELLGRSPAILAPQELNAVQFEAIERALRTGELAQTEFRARRKDGTTFWSAVSLSPVRDAQRRVTHYVSVGSDITACLEEAGEKRRLQDRLFSEMQERERMALEIRFSQKLEAVGRLAAGIAHEINTPMQYVGDSVTFVRLGLARLQILLNTYRSACAQLGEERPACDLPRVLAEIEKLEARLDWPFLSTEMPRAVERTLDGIARVTNIVQALSEFAHPDCSERCAADINRAIETTLAVARGEYKHVATVETQLGTIPEVLCNVGEINQVLLNLIVNAAHAIESAGKDASSGRICISSARAGAFVEIVVADNGCGIAEENLERIFDPFFTTKDVGKGTGQGLAIARSIVVDRHHGNIEVLSKVNLGTRFRLTLPVSGWQKDTAT